MTKLILLDRDGVINFDSPQYIKAPSEWMPLPGSLKAIADLCRAGYLVGICSNQAGVARGKLRDVDLDAIHDKMCAAIANAGARLSCAHYCRHHPDAGCHCRKPKPGMLEAAMRELSVQPEQTIFVGDSLRDVQASLAARCQPVLVRTGNGSNAEAQATKLTPLCVFDDLSHFVRELLS